MALLQDEFLELAAEKLFGIHFSDEQKRFLDYIKHGVVIELSEKDKENKEYMELVDELSNMHKQGRIPSFQVVLV